VLEHFARENVTVSHVQMAPMALYNYALYDRSDLIKSDEQAVVVLDMGAENTDLVVCTATTVWQRCIPMGGNAFTRAIADTFKLNFEKAEKLKRTAPMSKYARQVFQAMRPVFTDLASEIQRSLGFYTSSNPNTKLSRVIALGGGTKMRGLLKYLQQTLQVPVERPDSFKRLVISSGVSAVKFHESVCDFGVVYGLALQGLGLSRVESNLLPHSIARSMIWASKTKYFYAAACVILLVSLMCFARTSLDRVNYAGNSQVRQKINRIIGIANQAGNKLKAQESKASGSEAIIQKAFKPLEYRDVVPLLHQTLISVLPNKKNNPEQSELYKAFADGDVEAVLQIPRKERKQIFVTNMSIYFAEDVGFEEFDNTTFLKGGRRRGRGGGMFDSEMPFGMMFGMSGLPGAQSKFARRKRTKKKEGESEELEGAGFVVTIAGYSPYKNIAELMDPAGVGGEQDKWGIVTRLMHLEDIFGKDVPFKLYRRAEIEHFKLEIGEVDVDAEMPPGIGVEPESEKTKKAEPGELILIDPMTKETISRVAVLDEDGREKVDRAGNVVYEANDYWFILNVKFVWKDAPKEDKDEDKDK
jgi:type IV pilus assembly protein PilM